VEKEKGYLRIQRRWNRGDEVRLELPMSARMMESHPKVRENAGRVALMRGPLLYCLEGVDHPGVDLDEILLPSDIIFTTAFHPELLNGVVTIQAQGIAQPGDGNWEGRLYRPVASLHKDQTIEMTAVPYYAWGNRDAGQMQVWIQRGDRIC